MTIEITYRFLKDPSEFQKEEKDFYVEFYDGNKTHIHRLPVVIRNTDGTVNTEILIKNVDSYIDFLKRKYSTGFE